MSKKWKDVTKGGHKILFIAGPDIADDYAGVVESFTGGLFAINWDEHGKDRYTTDPEWRDAKYDLVPAEPKIKYRYVTVGQPTSAGYAYTSNAYPVCDHYSNLKLGFVKGKLVSAEVLAPFADAPVAQK